MQDLATGRVVEAHRAGQHTIVSRGEGRRAGGREKEARRQQILAAFDADGDGTLDETERAALAEAIKVEIRSGEGPGSFLGACSRK